jgi:hypothetical protein
MFPPPQKTENTLYFQYPAHLCIWMHISCCHVWSQLSHVQGPVWYFIPYWLLKLSCYTPVNIMLENHPLSAICKWLLNTFTATLCWRSTHCQPSANDYYIHSQLHYSGEPPLVSCLHMSIKYIHSNTMLQKNPFVGHLQMTTKFIHRYIMLENHPLLAICKSLLNIFTAALCWKTIPCQPYANDCYIYTFTFILHIWKLCTPCATKNTRRVIANDPNSMQSWKWHS